jgi:hypothetical protein
VGGIHDAAVRTLGVKAVQWRRLSVHLHFSITDHAFGQLYKNCSVTINRLSHDRTFIISGYIVIVCWLKAFNYDWSIQG